MGPQLRQGSNTWWTSKSSIRLGEEPPEEDGGRQQEAGGLRLQLAGGDGGSGGREPDAEGDPVVRQATVDLRQRRFAHLGHKKT